MSTQVQYRRGTEAQNNAFIGALAEITVDTTNGTLRVHNGLTAGGSNIATVAYVDTEISSIPTNAISDGTTDFTILSVNGNIRANIGGTTIITITNEGLLNGRANGVGNIGNASGYFDSIYAKATSALYADVAEKYQADKNYPPGTVVEIGGSHEVTASTQYASSRIAGVVSTDPALIMNSGIEASHAATVALLGRVPCRVIGPISKGDLITSSKRKGVATALRSGDFEPGCVIGKALADYPGTTEGVIEVLVGRL
jgi:hypothetical protein